jgi:hypothetical protein
MDQGTNQQSIQSATAQIQAPVDQQSVASTQQLPQPISGPSKEHAPVNQVINQEIIRATEQEPVLSPEIKDTGISIVPNQEHIQLKPELKEAGMTAVKTAVPIQTAPSDIIDLPMNETKAKEVIKTHRPSESIRWIATLSMYIFEQAKRLHQSIMLNEKHE